MTTIRVARRRRFTTVDRETINDERLSFRARGILVWLLDKPDDWRCNSDDIAAACTEGRDAVRTALRELQALDYVVRHREQDPATGQWRTVTDVFETPQFVTVDGPEDGIPGVGNPDVGCPDVGAPGPLLKTDTEDCERRETPSLALQAFGRPQRQVLYDALATGCGWNLDEMTKDAKRVTALAVNDLVDMGVHDPDEVVQRCMAYRLKFSGAACTPKAVVKHWPGLRPELVEAEQTHRDRMAQPRKESAADRVARIRREGGRS